MGRWTEPDPYDGIMDANDPQTFNRYNYTGNSPLTLVDPSGLGPEGPGGGGGSGGIFKAIWDSIVGPSSGPIMPTRPNGSRQNAQIWDEYHILYGANIGAALELPSTGGCEFGVCDSGPFGEDFTKGTGSSDPWAQGITVYVPPEVWVWAHRQTDAVHGNWQYGRYCGAGGAGRPENNTDALCMVHDYCFAGTNADSTAMTDASVWGKLSSGQQGAVRNYNQQLCNAVRAAPISPYNPNPRRRVADHEIPRFFSTQVPEGTRCR